MSSWFLRRYISSTLLISSISVILILAFAFVLNHAIDDSFINFESISYETLLIHYSVLLFAFILSVLVIDVTFEALRWRLRSNRSYVLIKALLQTLMTAAILYLHIFIVYLMHRYDVLQHYSATIHFLQAEAMPLIFIFFIIAFLTNLMLFISRFVGVKFTLNLVTNRYQQAKYENLVLMYLDLNDSTRLTEKLGNETFFEFEQEFFKDLAEATYQTRGDLEEYVGDEAVITWPLALGVKNQHCIRLFYLFKEKLAARQAFYLQRFGEMPTFKASLHSGEVLRGVVGINKIVVTRRGQVMNIGARILAECHNLKQNLLISQTLKDQLPTSNDYRFISLGSHNFKGSSDSLAIYGIQPVEKC